MEKANSDKEMVQVKIACQLCHKEHIFSVFKEDLEKFVNRKDSVQKCFPYLSAGDREMFLSGICDSCFEKMFKDDE